MAKQMEFDFVYKEPHEQKSDRKGKCHYCKKAKNTACCHLASTWICCTAEKKTVRG